MQVKKAIFQRMGSGGKGKTENRWDVSGAGQSATHGKSPADRQSDDRSVPGDTAECCSVSDISI